MPKFFSFGNLKLIHNSPQSYIWKKFQLEINNKIEQKFVVQAKKLSVAVLQSNYQFSEQQLVRKFLKISILFKFFWSRSAKNSLVSSENDWTFLVDRLTVWKEIQKKIFKNLIFFPACVVKLIRQAQKNINEDTFWKGKREVHSFSNFKQLMINTFSQICVVSVQWRFLGRKYQR